MLSPAQLLAGLADSLGVLGSGPRTVDERHQTIERSIEWSHSMLSDATRVVFRRLGVFASPFTLEAAQSVVAGDGVEPHEVVGELEHLIDQSLVQMDDLGAQPRFSLLETVRQFARRALEAAGETEAIAARHAAYFRAGRWASGRSSTTGWRPLLDTADAEYGDLVAMLTYLEQHATPEEHAEVAMACLPAIGVRHVAEVVALGEAAAARVEPTSVLGGPPPPAARPGRPDDAGPRADRAGGRRGHRRSRARRPRDLLGGLGRRRGRRRAETRWTAYERARIALGDAGEDHFSRTHWAVGALHRGMGRHTEAIQHSRRSVEETACTRCNVMVWSEATLLALARGDLGAADAALERAQAFALEVRDAGFSAHVRLSEVEVAAYAGKAWPAIEIEADRQADAATGNPLVTRLPRRGPGPRPAHRRIDRRLHRGRARGLRPPR